MKGAHDPELAAMRAIGEVLEPMPESERARVLLASIFLYCPAALSDEEILQLIRKARTQ